MDNLYVSGDEPVQAMSEAEAAAELLARGLAKRGNCIEVGVIRDVVAFTTRGGGHHLGNVHEDYDLDVHLVCSPGEITSGPLAGNISDEAEVYCNMVVRGLEEDWEGYAIPTHAPKPKKAVEKDRKELSDRLIALAEKLGIMK